MNKAIDPELADAKKRLDEWQEANPDCGCFVNERSKRPPETKFLIDLYSRTSPKMVSGFGPTLSAAIDAALKEWESKHE